MLPYRLRQGMQLPLRRLVPSVVRMFSDKPTEKSSSQMEQAAKQLKELASHMPEPAATKFSPNADDFEWPGLKDDEEASHGKSESDTFSAGEAGRTEQKEELIFKEVLSHVLSHPARPQPLASSKPKTTTPLADSILALFEKPAGAASTSGSRESVHPNRSVSLMDGLLNPRSDPQLSPEEIRKRESVTKQLSLVYKHIDSLPTNRDVIAYFKSVIVPRFDPNHRLDLQSTEPFAPDSVAVGPDTVSSILEKCISVLSKDFEDPLGAIHLFELSKHHSIEFFTEACSAGVYNQIIRIRWYDYRDIYAVVNLAAEIAINAIPATLETTELLSKVYREAYDSSKGMSTSPFGMPLWTGQEVRRLEELNRYRTRFQAAWSAKPILRF